MTKTAKATTKDQILDIAEHHFGIYGFAGTSLRAIIKDAGVNVAAVAYHFGSKEELFSAVLERFAAPVVEEQLEQLRRCMQLKRTRIEDVLSAFYAPPIKLIKRLGKQGETLSLFLGRVQTEPDPVYSMVDRHFAACRNEFITAFEQIRPGLSPADYQWRFEFMLSLIVCFLTRQKPIRLRYTEDSNWDPDEAIERLIEFCAAGIKAS